MSDSRKRLQDEAPTPLSGFFATMATVAAVSIAVLISPAGNYTASEANAASATAAGPDLAAIAEEYVTLIHQGHERAAREGDASPASPSF